MSTELLQEQQAQQAQQLALTCRQGRSGLVWGRGRPARGFALHQRLPHDWRTRNIARAASRTIDEIRAWSRAMPSCAWRSGVGCVAAPASRTRAMPRSDRRIGEPTCKAHHLIIWTLCRLCMAGAGANAQRRCRGSAITLITARCCWCLAARQCQPRTGRYSPQSAPGPTAMSHGLAGRWAYLCRSPARHPFKPLPLLRAGAIMEA